MKLEKRIFIALNDMKYRYDIYQMFNMFYILSSIEFESENWDYSVEIGADSITLENKNKKEIFEFDKKLNIKENIKKIIFSYLTKETKKEMPWGTLVGIRPSKIALSLLNEGKDYDYIVNYFEKHSCTRKDKVELCINIAKIEEDVVNVNEDTISIYVGMPFCPTKCVYCSFTSNPIEGCKKIVTPYLNALEYEISKIAQYVRERKLKVQCVYFGGGTPTSVDNEQFEKIMKHIYNSFVVDKNIKEFTVECGRPDSITLEKLKTMKKYQVDRISINPQTMNDDTLKLIGRRHSVSDVIDKFNMAREVGFGNINMDIIVGLPGENLSHIENTYEKILKLNPDSLTVHGMSVKRGSRLYENLVNHIKFNIPNQEELNSMYERTVTLSKDLKMKPYYMYRQKNMIGNMENVGYCKENEIGLYNIQMIEEKQTIIACGADAVTKVVFLNENRIERQANIKDVREYTSRIEEMVEKKIKLLNTLY